MILARLLFALVAAVLLSWVTLVPPALAQHPAPPGAPRPSLDLAAQPPGAPRPSSNLAAQPPGAPRRSLDVAAQPPGQFDYYLFTLSWSPAFCLTHRDDPKAREECGRHRGFVVHGLWPQNEDGSWPDFCRIVPPVPPAIVSREAARMPNAGLVQHEWERHGSCTLLSAGAYFDALDRVSAGLQIPQVLAKPTAPLSMPLADAKSLFVAANPGLMANMMSMRCTHDGAIVELQVCLDKSFKYRACGHKAEDFCPSEMHFDPILGARE